MGKTIKLTEEQIRRFFGKGFGEYIFEKASSNPETNPFAKIKLHQDTLKKASNDYVKGDNNPNKSDDAQSNVGFNYTSREGKDLPGYGGSVAKMADFGAADLTSENAIGNQEFLRAIKSLHKDGPLNLIDVLDILHRIKNGEKPKDKDGKEMAIEAKDFLDSIQIDYILSNFVTVNAPDYVFWRLKNLSTDEINRIKSVYKRDFSEFGQRCDGCGASAWKTTITPFAHDDAHINLEYMGGEAATNTSNFAKVNEDASAGRRFYTYRIPFQIHHMNENPGDNSPLNLSCLCPNCHAITGSYGKAKSEFDDDTFAMLNDLENMFGGENGAAGSLNELMDPKEKEAIVKSLKSGEFEKRSIVNSIMGVLTSGEIDLTPADVSANYLMDCGIDDIDGFVSDFNDLFRNICSAGLKEYEEYHKLNLKEAKAEKHKAEEEETTQSENDVVRKATVALNGIPVTYEVRNTGNKILLSLYAGELPFIFSAFKTHAIALTSIYFDYNEKKILEIRNQVLGGILNAIKNVKKSMSDKMNPENLPGWMTRDAIVTDEYGNPVKDDKGNPLKKKVINQSAITDVKPGSEVRIDPKNGKILTGVDDAGNYTGEYGEYGDLDTLHQGRERAKGMYQDKLSVQNVGVNFSKAAKGQSRQNDTIPDDRLLPIIGSFNNGNQDSLRGTYGNQVVDDLLRMKTENNGILTPDMVRGYLSDKKISYKIPKKSKTKE